MSRSEDSVLRRLAAEAVRQGANALEVGYRDGYEEAVAMRGALGYGIARLPSSGPEAASLRNELGAIARRKRTMILDDQRYEVSCEVFDSFGADAYRVEFTSG